MVRILCVLRALLLIPVFIPVTAFLSSMVILVVVLGLPRSWAFFIVRDIWCRSLLFCAGVKVIVEGRENLPVDKGFLFLFTHSSHFDIPILVTSSPKNFNFGAKIELFSVPFFGRAMAAIGTLPIARNDRRKVIEVYRNAEERVARGDAFALAPEGGRRTTVELAPFKTGPFIFAINAKMPLVPAVIYGADQVLQKKSFLINSHQWITKVKIRFLPAIPVVDFSTDTAKVLREQVREKMVEAYEDLRKSD